MEGVRERGGGGGIGECECDEARRDQIFEGTFVDGHLAAVLQRENHCV